jgi:acetyl-CoA carboxylase carboxyl transferase subunit alpha
LRSYLDFEKPVAEIEAKVDELRAVAEANGSDSVRDEAARLQNRANASLRELYASLTPWQKTMAALSRLSRQAHRGFHAARRRSPFWRG